ncbi:MAG: hypothetical protein ABI551_14935, partial [Polyangiaceae bacterium]
STWNAFVLGHLFERYLVGGGKERAPVVTEDEAKKIRRAVDGALRGAFKRDLKVKVAPLDEKTPTTGNLVKQVERFVMHVPETLLARLYTAFDDLMETVESPPKERRAIDVGGAAVAATA